MCHGKQPAVIGTKDILFLRHILEKFWIMFAAVFLAGPAMAQERETVGVGRLFTNDWLGDGKDRWRSGSFTVSLMRGPAETQTAPEEFGALLEYRLRSEILAPSTLNGAGSNDRAYVGALSAGLHSHFSRGDWNLSTGLDLVFVGPQTKMATFQNRVHNLISAQSVGAAVQQDQIANAVYPTFVANAAYVLPVGDTMTLMPFAEVQYGVEDMLRIGADILIGDAIQADLWLRDTSSGQLYSGVDAGGRGTAFVLGADYAVVGDSAYFPASFGTEATDERWRVRAGIHSRLGEGASFFYGVSYLSEEYVGQDQGQVVGSVRLNFDF